jgi:hypothetical protein
VSRRRGDTMQAQRCTDRWSSCRIHAQYVADRGRELTPARSALAQRGSALRRQAIHTALPAADHLFAAAHGPESFEPMERGTDRHATGRGQSQVHSLRAYATRTALDVDGIRR